MFNVMVLSWNVPLDNPALVQLRENGCNVIVKPGYPGITEDTLIEHVGPEIDGVICGVEPFTRYVIERLPRLKSIARTGVGFDSIDVPAAADHNVIVTTTPGANRHAVADHTLVFMLMLTRLIPANQKMVVDGKWTRVVGWDAYAKTLGIIGVGAIGKEVARRSIGFDMPLLGYDINPDYAFAEKHNLKYVELDELMAQSDFVSLHLPYYPATHHIVGEREISLMKPTSYLINTARGGLIDEDALYNALVEKRLRGAALDVCENEPNFASPLLQLDNVIWTPHVAGITLESRLACFAGACQNSWAVLRGEGEYFQIKPGALY
jgi:D-3-phosphoglycerate dehydrogenase / 2-oxoglutarate reductase